LGFVTAVLDGKVLLDRIALRRTREGRLALSFPSRTDRDGRRHHVVRPLTDAARREIEAQILSSLGLAEEAAP
jgi:DNA-binding cell septation regulator SpoVG